MNTVYGIQIGFLVHILKGEMFLHLTSCTRRLWEDVIDGDGELGWWKNNEHLSCPILSEIVCVPAKSSLSERVCCTADQIAIPLYSLFFFYHGESATIDYIMMC